MIPERGPAVVRITDEQGAVVFDADVAPSGPVVVSQPARLEAGAHTIECVPESGSQATAELHVAQ